MPKQQNTPYSRPHDRYFEQVFKNLHLVKQLLSNFLPFPQQTALDLETLELTAESFLSEELREAFADLVYSCQTSSDSPVRVCLLLEHKSRPAGRRIYPQLAQYLRGIQEEDIRQGRKPFTLALPVLFYHGKERWNPKPLREHYGSLPEVLAGYVPHFDICIINVRDLDDELIWSLRDAVLLQKVLLAFKYAYDRDFWQKNFRELFIFVGEKLPKEIADGIFSATLRYFYSVTNFNDQEMANLVDSLPPVEGKKFVSTYDNIFGKGVQEGLREGMQEGLQKGLHKGLEKALLAFLKKFPDWTDEQLASTFEVDLETVQRVRAQI